VYYDIMENILTFLQILQVHIPAQLGTPPRRSGFRAGVGAASSSSSSHLGPGRYGTEVEAREEEVLWCVALRSGSWGAEGRLGAAGAAHEHAGTRGGGTRGGAS
jgi:hypothetical protein